MPGRTDAILAAVRDELNRNRVALDANTALESVTLTVRLEVRRGVVRRVGITQESAREL